MSGTPASEFDINDIAVLARYQDRHARELIEHRISFNGFMRRRVAFALLSA